MKRKQNGHAGIVFVLILPVLWGITAVCLDASRGLQTKVRLDEAVDSAVIAISADDVKNDQSNAEIVETYISSYLPEAVPGEPEIIVKNCDSISNCTHYDVTANITLDTWFPGGGGVSGFSETIALSGNSHAQKLTSEKPAGLDVIVVADISSSMSDKWEFERKDKHIREAIYRIWDSLDDIDESAKGSIESTYGHVGVESGYITERFGVGRECYMSELTYSGYHDNTAGWNLSKTVEEMFTEKDSSHCIRTPWIIVNPEFLPTPNYRAKTQVVADMEAWGGTSSIDGLIRGVQLLKTGNNKNKLLLMISDAEDTWKQAEKYLELSHRYQWCEKMRDHLSTTNSGEKVNLTFAGLHMGYNNIEWFNTCFGKENIYTSSSVDDFFENIDSLINNAQQQDVGHYVK